MTADLNLNDMDNPWLSIPLEDYEGHMASPEIRQAQMLAESLAEALDIYVPRSVAILGCAGGNGFTKIPRGFERVVGVDINPGYLEAAAARYRGRFATLELIAGDLQSDELRFEPVDLVYAGLVLEYVDVDTAMRRIRAMLTPGGRLLTVVQLPTGGHAHVAPSPFGSMQTLGDAMRLVDPARLRVIATAHRLDQMDSRGIADKAGKRFQRQVFVCEPV